MLIFKPQQWVEEATERVISLDLPSEDPKIQLTSSYLASRREVGEYNNLRSVVKDLESVTQRGFPQGSRNAALPPRETGRVRDEGLLQTDDLDLTLQL